MSGSAGLSRTSRSSAPSPSARRYGRRTARRTGRPSPQRAIPHEPGLAAPRRTRPASARAALPAGLASATGAAARSPHGVARVPPATAEGTSPSASISLTLTTVKARRSGSGRPTEPAGISTRATPALYSGRGRGSAGEVRESRSTLPSARSRKPWTRHANPAICGTPIYHSSKHISQTLSKALNSNWTRP